MLTHVHETDIDAFRKALSDSDVNVITFNEPARSEKLPYMPATPLSPFQFWYVNENWKDNWDRFENSVADEFNVMAKGISLRTRRLLEIFSEMTGDDKPFVSLRAITPEYFSGSTASVSAGWHRDASVFTLQDTMMGEPLEYTNDENVRRQYFDQKQIQPFATPDQDVLKEESAVLVVPKNNIAILKGELRADEADKDTLEFLDHFIDTTKMKDFNRGRSLIHRGHKDTKNGRLVLTVSTHKVPDWMPKNI